jgi:hypothetical protein
MAGLVRGIHAFLRRGRVDGRVKPGHDAGVRREGENIKRNFGTPSRS